VVVSLGRAIRWTHWSPFALAALAASALACGEPDPTEPIPIYAVAPVGPIFIGAPAGSELPRPIEVQVREPSGVPAKGVAVVFRVVAGRGATLADTLVATGADGVGTTWLRLGPLRDSVVVLGSVRGQEERGVTFRVLPGLGPELSTVQPAAVAPGDTVVLRGIRLSDPRGAEVLFGTVRARLVGATSDTLLRAVVPPCLPAQTIAVTVRAGGASTNPVPATLALATTPLALRVGEGVTVAGTESGCLRLATAGERYVVVPQFAAFADTIPASRNFALVADAATASTASTVSTVEPHHRAALDAGPAATPDVRAIFERRLRAEEILAAGTLGARVGDTAAANALALLPPEPPAIGTTRNFHVLTRLDGTAFGTANARLRYAGTNILLYEDVASPAPMLDITATALGDLIDRTLYPIDVEAFGSESDIDANGRVIVLLSPLVNAITPVGQCGAGGFVPGFFYGIDLDTRHRNSNRGEIFYAIVPDPRGERSCPRRLEDVLAVLPPTFLHEFQHMISYNQHVLVRRGAAEATWLNEGLSHMAEELGARYYDARYPAPAGRTTPAQLLPDSAVPFLRANLDNASLFLATTPFRSVVAFRDFGTLEERGAAWLFIRWLVAQKGDRVLSRLVQSGLRGGQNVESAAGEPFAALFGDFALALYADSIPGVARAAVSPRFRMGERTLRELFARAGAVDGYPLAVREGPAAGTTATGAMVQGTGTYFQLTVPAGGVTLRLTGPNDTALSPTLGAQLGVIRVGP
jgi:hypothetical protein